MSTNQNLIHIIKESYYQSQLIKYSKLFSRMHDVQFGIEFTLSRFPMSGTLFEFDIDLWLYRTDEAYGAPGFSVVYHYRDNSNKIHLLSLISRGIVM